MQYVAIDPAITNLYPAQPANCKSMATSKTTHLIGPNSQLLFHSKYHSKQTSRKNEERLDCGLSLSKKNRRLFCGSQPGTASS